ncbi:DUF1643 domain-containing protein [Pedosphaera parvula]|uniref:DUF1643 domain-containing protein n=1 Tax=Pedosphaera parvula (strain Ellin514) TaxID=320771 RepID=B9XFB4_PEDPL|nr:DUF1643 domain-containing protein [Pedosphaera parvula]EEF61612.1 protein of unknown function DUF1643 [Pedosphaera parvula Ellin514]
MRKGTDRSGAIFSDCENYRYSLWRIWDDDRPYVAFIGLNPSTADELKDDPTVARCRRYAEAWNYGGMYMLNLFAFRATQPEVMKGAKDPVGRDNDKRIMSVVKEAGLVMAIWGNHGAHRNRSVEVMGWLKNLNCLKVNKSGEPCHPLYLKKNLKPKPFAGVQRLKARVPA